MQSAESDLAVVLASGSPRRRELLAQLGLEFAVVVPNIDESVDRKSTRLNSSHT